MIKHKERSQQVFCASGHKNIGRNWQQEQTSAKITNTYTHIRSSL